MFSMLCVFNDHDRVGRAKLGNLDDLSPDSDIFWFPWMEFDGYYYLMQDLTALDELPYRLVKKEGLIDGHHFQSPFPDIKFMNHNVLIYKAKTIDYVKMYDFIF